MAKYKIVYNKSGCIGCGACAAICPEFWEMDDEGLSLLKESKTVEDHEERIITSEDERAQNQEVADTCPAQVISVEDAE